MRKWMAGVGVGLAGPWVWPLTGAWAEEPLGALWGNTTSACLESGANAPETHTGSVLWALLLVLGLLVFLAWWLKRWPRPEKIAEAKPQGRLRLCNRFNASQTFMLWEEAGKAYALIMKNNRVEMFAELPGIRSDRGEHPPQAVVRAPKTFQEIWINLIKPTRKS